MMKALAGRMREEEGFTLIELMVVVMILAILIVMGLPTFLGVKARFQDRGAQTDLRNTVLAARIMFTDNATFASANETGTGLVTIVPNQCYVAGGTASVATGSPVLREWCGRGVDQRGFDGGAILGRPDVDLHFVLRDLGRHDRDEVRRDDRRELQRYLGRNGRQRHRNNSGGRRLVSISTRS